MRPHPPGSLAGEHQSLHPLSKTSLPSSCGLAGTSRQLGRLLTVYLEVAGGGRTSRIETTRQLRRDGPTLQSRSPQQKENHFPRYSAQKSQQTPHILAIGTTAQKSGHFPRYSAHALPSTPTLKHRPGTTRRRRVKIQSAQPSRSRTTLPLAPKTCAPRTPFIHCL